MKAQHYQEVRGITRLNFVAVWRLGDGKLLHILEGEAGLFSADSRLFLVQTSRKDQSGESQAYGQLYDLKSGNKLDEWPGEKFTFLSDNSLVVESKSYVRIYDIRTHKASRAFEGYSATFSPDQQMLAIVSASQINLYRVSDGTFLRKLERSMPQFSHAVLKFSPNGEILAGITGYGVCCGGSVEQFSVWRVADGLLIRVDHGIGSSFVISPDSNTLIVNSGTGIFEILRMSDGVLLTRVDWSTLPIENLAFTPDGQSIVTGLRYSGTDISSMLLYDINGGPFGIPQITDKEEYTLLLDDSEEVKSPSGRFIARKKGMVHFFRQIG